MTRFNLLGWLSTGCFDFSGDADVSMGSSCEMPDTVPGNVCSFSDGPGTAGSSCVELGTAASSWDWPGTADSSCDELGIASSARLSMSASDVPGLLSSSWEPWTCKNKFHSVLDMITFKIMHIFLLPLL